MENGTTWNRTIQLGGIILVAILSAASAQAASAPARSWDDLNTIAAGQKIRVHTAKSKQNGNLVSVTDSVITLRNAGGVELMLPRAEVRRVYAQSRSHRLRNTVIGAAVGAGVGVAVYATLGAFFRNEGSEITGLMIGVPVMIATGVGAALPTGTMDLVYKAPEPVTR